MILNDATLGAIGNIYWFEKTSREVPEHEVDKIRQKAMSDMLYGAIQSAMYSGANQSMDVNTAMQRGWVEGNKQIDMVQNGTEMKHEMFLIGDPNTVPRLEQIQSNPDFRGWTNPYLIEQIKQAENE
jgi:hypothetical protein